MNRTLKWTKHKSIMIALFFVNGIGASKFNRFIRNHIGILENSYYNVMI
jgi:hypothetical protein